ncbi:dihydroflavonol 4-reductase [Quercus suber]|uniref:Dihydroflavonol 4-reductase n=1 Tax=Quercus suber TaxID=58331 RepID=A0AAW0IT04_QUESU
MKKILVTGATGYLGGRLCHALLQQGHPVRVLVRRTSDLSSLPPPTDAAAAIEIVYGDVTDYRSLLSACSDCHVIFHVAAVVEPWLPDPSKFFSVNVGGLKNVLQAVHHEKYFCTEYEKSKAYADKIAIQAASEGVPIVAVYPGVIYGPGKVTAGNVVARMIYGNYLLIWVFVKVWKRQISFSHVDDVVEGHIAAMNKGQPGERYLLTGENASFRHVFDIAAIITETKKPLFSIPFWAIDAYGWASVMFSRITGKLPLISPRLQHSLTTLRSILEQTVNVLKHQWAYSCEKAKVELDYNPRSLKEGLAEMLHWLKNLGLIKF